MDQGSTERDLLFGALALREGLIDQSTLADALLAWSGDRSSTLADRIQAGADLDPTQADRVRTLVDRQVGSGSAEASTLAASPGPAGMPDRTATVDPDVTEADVTRVHDPDATEVATPSRPRGPDAGGGRNGQGRGERFRILRPHAQGGLGVVSVALDAELNREVAFKQILRHHADDDQSQARFLLEAEITGGSNTPVSSPSTPSGPTPLADPTTPCASSRGAA